MIPQLWWHCDTTRSDETRKTCMNPSCLNPCTCLSGGSDPCDPNPCGAASCTVEDGAALCHGESQTTGMCLCVFTLLLSFSEKILNSWLCYGDYLCLWCLYSWTSCMLYIVDLHLISLSLQVTVSDKHLTECDLYYIHCLWQIFVSLPAVLSWCVLRPMFFVRPISVLFLFCICVWLWVSVCSCGRFESQGVRQISIGSAVRLCSRCVSRVFNHNGLHRLRVVFGVATPVRPPPPLCCVHVNICIICVRSSC